MKNPGSIPGPVALASPTTDSKLRDLLVFHNVARALTSSLDRDAILRAIMQQMEQFFKPETWSLLLMDEARNDLYYAVAVGYASADLRDQRVPMGHGLAGWVAQHGESLIVPEVSEDPRYDARFAPLTQGAYVSSFHIHSAICMPLRSRNRTLGVIQLFNAQLDSLTDYTISFLHVLCDYAAIAIDNARAVERIQELTITDDCTGLYNVRHLYRMLEEYSDAATHGGAPFSLIFIDIDHFKDVNDRHGHLVGSHILSEVGQTLRAGLRRQDIVFRYGGDEFVILLPGAGKRAAQIVAERILKNMRERRFGNVLSLEIRASFGVATWPEDGATVHEIIRSADTTMYLVKGTTRDNVAIAGKGILPAS
ncbi:MAG TPA: sensor domain-containing diguanylate cyclase [Acidobacteriaceae bacterium]|nr:sensor domain-containing diguanylate cyclase [Acidobacteriaceae bacterium]